MDIERFDAGPSERGACCGVAHTFVGLCFAGRYNFRAAREWRKALLPKSAVVEG